jgi:integrase
MAGLRIGEALALRWADIELLADPPRLNVSRTWDPASKPEGAAQRGLEGQVKTGEEGNVTIGRRLLEQLEGLLTSIWERSGGYEAWSQVAAATDDKAV